MSIQQPAAATQDERPANGVGVCATTFGLWLYYLTPIVRWNENAPLILGLALSTLVVAVGLLLERGRFPVVAATGLGALLLLSPGVIGAVLVALAHLARRQGPSALVVLASAWTLACKVLGLLLSPISPGWSQAATVELTLAASGVVIAVLVGSLARSRAAETRSRTDMEAARSDAEEARLDRARMAEREKIAREMHDVLAHRLSLVALHAGALTLVDRLDADTTRETAQLIQANARQSLTELRAVLSTLRGTDAAPEPPQPSLHQLPALLEESGRAGQAIAWRCDVDIEDVPAGTSRHLYRIVQEGLTNARKHAPGAPVTVALTGADGELRLRVSNPLADLALPDATGARLGLLGVAERAEAAGGTASHGVTDGAFTLDVRLPWPQAEPREDR